MGNEDKRRFTKLISIFMGNPLIVRDCSDLLTIIAVVMRDEIPNFCDHLIMKLLPYMHRKVNIDSSYIISSTNGSGGSYTL
jgi:hypothetical protein